MKRGITQELCYSSSTASEMEPWTDSSSSPLPFFFFLSFLGNSSCSWQEEVKASNLRLALSPTAWQTADSSSGICIDTTVKQVSVN